ncbi:MAG: S26 family signal peptidase [Thermoguttaceae bacterium]
MVKKNLKKDVKPDLEESPGTFRWIREAVETLAIALVLAFLFKGYVAEAYVIPTGSMGPTLMGLHKDVHCPQCGIRYKVGASEEQDEGNNNTTSRRINAARRGEPTPPPPAVVAGTCPQCRYTAYFGKDNLENQVHLTYEGDRIFVCKYLFDFWEPARWDVTVFRFPGGPQTNFIKRLIGLENETIRIQNGDIFVKSAGSEEFKIARKPANHLFSMLQVVNDNNHLNPKLLELGWASSWSDGSKGATNDLVEGIGSQVESGEEWDLSSGWKTDDHRVFWTRGDSDRMLWLNYHHIVPSSKDWQSLEKGELPPDGMKSNPQLITDFYSYNSGIVRDPPEHFGCANANSHVYVAQNQSGEKKIRANANPDTVGFNWTGDLVLDCRVTVLESHGKLAFRLVKGGIPFLCEVNLGTGIATLSIEGVDAFKTVEGSTNLNGLGQHRVQFANVDEQMRLWVDGREVEFPGNGEYDTLCESGVLKRDRSPTELDLTPVSIGSQDAKIEVDQLKIFRDLYYIAVSPGSGNNQCDLLRSPFYFGDSVETELKNAAILSNPALWSTLGKTRKAEFLLEKDQFFLLGDNSPRSMDARVWKSLPGGGQYASRSDLIGQAAIVYWPHGLRIPLINRPYIPNLGDMRFIE